MQIQTPMRKKYTLFSTFTLLMSIATAQNVKPTVQGGAMPAAPKNRTEVATANNNINTKPAKIVNRGYVNQSNWIKLGSTFYDLQSNYAIGRRAFLAPNGDVFGIWTTSPNQSTNFPQRGTGYNFKPSNGSWLTETNSRIESGVRSGWPSIGLLSNGNPWVLAHDASVGGFYFSKFSSASSRSVSSDLVLQEVPLKPIWARACSNGDTIHVIYSYTDSSEPGEKRAPTRKGIFAPMVYSRSLNGGQTWDIRNLMLPKYDSTLTNNGGADQYAIDCRGSNVIVVNADLLQGVVVWKSTDFGTTWTRKFADSFPYAPYSAKKLMLDTPFTNDGTVSCMIDKNGNGHVFWGIGRAFDDDTTDASYSFFPGTQGLGYWNEATGISRVIANGVAFDRDDDGDNQVTEADIAILNNGALPASRNNPAVTLGHAARLGNSSVLRQPSCAVDANGNLYCSFSITIESDLYDGIASYRDIGLVYSTNGGTSWSTPQNITQAIGKEDDFCSLARDANGFLHMVWQQDNIPGTNLQNNSTAAGNHPPEDNTIFYQALPVDDILNNRIGMQWGLKTVNPNTGNVQLITNVYPNPTSGKTTMLVNLTEPGALTIEVTNTLGQKVKTQNLNRLGKGNHALEMDMTGMPTGIYYFNVIAGGNRVTRSFVVK